MLLLLSLLAGAAEPTSPKVLIELTIVESDDAGLLSMLDEAARCQPAALGGADAPQVLVSALRGGDALSVLAAPSLMTLDGQQASVQMGHEGAMTEVAVTPYLEDAGIRLDAGVRLALDEVTHAGDAAVLLASGHHAVWPAGDTIVVLGARTTEADPAAVLGALGAQREAAVASLPRGQRARLRAIDAALGACP